MSLCWFDRPARAGVEEIDIPVRDLDDGTVMKIMAHENQSEWGHTAIVDQETIRAVVIALGEGRIELPPVPLKNGKGGERRVRIAPSFVQSLESGHHDPKKIYTAAMISAFLGGAKAGWPDAKIEAVLRVAAGSAVLGSKTDIISLGQMITAMRRQLAGDHAVEQLGALVLVRPGVLDTVSKLPRTHRASRTHFPSHMRGGSGSDLLDLSFSAHDPLRPSAAPFLL